MVESSTSGKPPLSAAYRITYRILGIILIIMGFIIAIVNPVFGVAAGVLGSICVQVAARNSEISKGIAPKHPLRRLWQIIVIALYVFPVMAGILIPTTIQSIATDGDEYIELKVPEAQQLVFKYEPATANANDIKCTSSDDDIVTITIDNAEKGKVLCTVTPVSAGTATITCTAPDISSAPVKLSITDPVAEAEAERKAAEEAAKQAEHEAAEKKAQEILSKANEDQPNDEPTGQTVYVTRSGERYHLDPDCAGKSARAVDINDVGARTPCKKCAGG